MPVQFNQLLKWGFNLFNGNSWTELFGGLGQLFSRLIYYLIVCAVGKIADICQLIFRKFAGLSDGLMVGNKVVEGDLVYYLFQHPIVKNLLISLALLAAFILIIATFVGTIKTEFAKDGNNNKRKVIKNAFRGLANFVLVPVICMFGIFIGNALLRAIDGATGGGSGSLASQMFLVGGYNANRARMSENNGADRDNNPYELGSFGDVLTGQSDGGAERGYGNFGIFLDDGGNSLTGRRAADKIDAFFENGAIITKAQMENMSPIQHTLKFSALSTYYGGALADNVKVDYKDIDYGGSNDYASRSESITYDDGKVSIPYTAEITFSVYNAGLVYYYYDLTLGTFDYFISTIAMLFCAYTLLVTVLGLIKRLFMLTTLFVISAPVCAIYPIDEGKALERWRAEFIKETLSAYSTVVVMNIFLSLLPIIKEITVFANNGDLGILGNIPMIKGFANYMARVLIVVAGLVFFKDASKTIAGVIGAGDATGDGASASGKFAAGVKRVAGGVALGAGAVMGAARMAGKGIGAAKNAISNAKDRSFQEKNQAKYDALMNQQNGENGPADDGDTESKANAPGSTGAEQNSMNSPSTGSTSSASTGGSDASSAKPDIPMTPDGKVDWRAARKKESYEKRYGEGSWKDLQEHKAMLKKIGGGVKKVAGATGNLIAGFGDSIKGLVKGDLSMKDAFNFTKGSRDHRKKLKEKKLRQEDREFQRSLYEANHKNAGSPPNQQANLKKLDSADKDISTDDDVKNNLSPHDSLEYGVLQLNLDNYRKQLEQAKKDLNSNNDMFSRINLMNRVKVYEELVKDGENKLEEYKNKAKENKKKAK